MTEGNSRDVSRRTYVKAAGLVGTAGIAGLAGCTGNNNGNNGGNGGNSSNSNESSGGNGGNGGKNQLELVHWWTAGGEKDALQALVDGFKKKHPDVNVKNNPAPGGAGSALDTVIKNRVLNKNPPSSFQIWPGKALTPYTKGNVLNDLDGDVWDSDMKDAYISGVKDLAKPNGKFVAVPLDIHRLNNIFYNKKVLDKAGVDPKSLKKPGDLVDAMKTISDKTDAVGMAQQTKTPWSTLQLWETDFIGAEGVDAYMDLIEGNVSNHEQGVKDSLTRITKYKKYFNQDAGSLSWDQANSKVINGEAAMIHQGDWAAGQYTSADDFKYNEDWGYIPYPGTDGTYSIVTDSFVFPKNNPSPDATKKWLKYVGSVEGQKKFNPIKGSIPPRKDVPTDPFGPFQQDQIKSFKNSKKQPPTITHGTSVTPDIHSNIENVISGFTENWDVDKAYNGLKNAWQ